MVSVQRPAFVPDPSLDREQMESLQREIAEAAVFEDAFAFDPAAIGTTAAQPRSDDADDRAEPQPADSPDQQPTDRPAQQPVDRPAQQPADCLEPQPADPPIVAGIDQAFQASDGSEAGPGEFDEAVSAVVATRGGEVIERVHATTPLAIPYIPGLLAFREGESILAALAELSADPDLLLFDGSGRIHFRDAGIATHVGAAVELPAVGVAKSLLCGTPRWDAARTAHLAADSAAGAAAPDTDDVREGDPLDAGTIVPIEADDSMTTPDGTVVGAAVQTRQFEDTSKRSINPLYVSPGHRVGWETAANVALATATEYKLPEPIRLADRWVGELTAAE